MKPILTALACVATLAAAQGALAQQQWSGSYSPSVPTRSSGLDNLGEEMQFVFGVDGVMGIDMISDKTDEDDGLGTGGTTEVTAKTTNVHLFGGGAAGLPRLALDYFVIEGLSLGGSFVYMNRSLSGESDAGSVDIGSEQTLFVHPRVGYAIPFDETFSFWPRAGLAFHSLTQTTDAIGTQPESEVSFTSTNLTLEGMFGISPMSHFAILVGPYVYFGLGGSRETDPGGGAATTEVDRNLTLYGLTTSIVGYY